MKPGDGNPRLWMRRARARSLSRARQHGEVRFGLITDLHYADKPGSRGRRYRRSLAKLREAVRAFNEAGVDFTVCLGDAIDSGDSPAQERGYLAAVRAEWAALRSQRHHVPGNHDVDRLTKDQFAEHFGVRLPPYSFESGGVRFVFLDACFRADGEPHGRRRARWHEAHLPDTQLVWLRKDLADSAKPAIVFIHQRLDRSDDDEYAVDNASAVRRVLREAGTVRAVFQGHSHRNDLRRIHQIPYCTLPAVIRSGGPGSNAYAIGRVRPEGPIHVVGFGRQRGCWL